MVIGVWEWLGNNVSAIIAICALVFTAYQSHLTRTHNRISVKPKLTTFAKRNSENDIGVLNIKLFNKGTGPAIVKKYQFELDGIIQDFSDSAEALTFIQDLVGVIGVRNSITTLSPEQVISAGEYIEIMDISFMEYDNNGWIHIEELMDRLSIRVKYCSIYDEFFEYHSIESHSL